METILLLTRAKKASKIEQDALRAYISPVVDDASESGWEEQTLAAVQHLLTKSQGQQGVVTKMQPLEDLGRLKNGLKAVFEALERRDLAL